MKTIKTISLNHSAMNCICMMLLITLACGPLLEVRTISSKVKSVTGSATFQDKGKSKVRQLKPGIRLKEGTRIKTSAGATVIIVVVPGTAIQISENSDVVLSKMLLEEGVDGVTVKRTGRVHVNDGTVSTLIEKSKVDVNDFEITTPQGSAAARGTFYGVTVRNGKMYVKVKEGSIGFYRSKERLNHK